jgi:acyl-CoA oxidase
MKPLNGVKINDMGVKFGLNGVDNAALKFNQVRIPRENMLNRYCDVDENGVFHSDIARPSQRFFKVTERLLSGRICIAAIAQGASRACLHIAIKYAQQRRSIGPDGESSVAIMDYQLQKNALMPLLARTMALNCMYNKARNVFKNPTGMENELISICCITKTMAGWNCERVAAICRERCGGMGYLSNSRFGEYLAVAHASITAEGDNRVLMVKIVKDMITNITKNGHKLPEPSLNVVKQIGSFLDVTQLDTILDLFKFREATLFKRLMARNQALSKAGTSGYNILMRETSDNMQALALAYGERNTMEECIKTLAKLNNKENVAVMTMVFRLFGLDTIRRDLGFYMVEKAISREAAENTTGTLHMLNNKIADNIDALCASLNVPGESLHVPITKDYVEYYAHENYGEIRGARL